MLRSRALTRTACSSYRCALHRFAKPKICTSLLHAKLALLSDALTCHMHRWCRITCTKDHAQSSSQACGRLYWYATCCCLVSSYAPAIEQFAKYEMSQRENPLLQRGTVEVLHLGRKVSYIDAPATFGEAALLKDDLDGADKRLSGYRTSSTSMYALALCACVPSLWVC